MGRDKGTSSGARVRESREERRRVGWMSIFDTRLRFSRRRGEVVGTLERERDGGEREKEYVGLRWKLLFTWKGERGAVRL